MITSTILLLSATVAELVPPKPMPVDSEARKVMEVQLRPAPRSQKQRLENSERSVIEQRYLQSIGQSLQTQQGSVSRR